MSNALEEKKVRFPRIREWWQRIVVVRMKALVYTSLVIVMLVVGNQVQNAQINNARVKEVEDRQDQVCTSRIQTRKDLREVLFYVVDLSDVLPGEPKAEAYTMNRIAFINEKYPEITKADC